VMRALPAHWMRFSADGLNTGKYWDPPFEVSIRYPRDEDYFEHYREVFSESVRRSSRTHLPLSCDVSGGLDSSAVFAMAHDLRRAGRLQAPAVEGYTFYFPDAAGEPHDEIEYARAVAAHVGERVQEIEPFLPDFSWFVERGRADRTIAGYPNGAMAVAIGEKLVADGSRVILNGEGGDEWAGGNRFYYWEHIEERDWRGLAESLQLDTAAFGWRTAAGMLWRNGLAHHLPEPVIVARRRLLDAVLPMASGRARLLAPELRRELGRRHARRTRESEFRQIHNRARRAMYMVLTDPFAAIIWDQASRQSSHIGYEVRAPLYSRRYIEFSFSTPDIIKIGGNKQKVCHKSSLKNFIPNKVYERNTKAEFSISFAKYLSQREVLVPHIRTGLPESWVRAAELFSAIEGFSQATPPSSAIWQLWTIVEIATVVDSQELASRTNIP
jgi:asparagine synthase (glutamine-hydrolysing)